MIRTRKLFLKLIITTFVLCGLFLIFMDARITATFSDKMWELPAKVYARPLELFVGARLTREDLAYELQVLGYRRVSALRKPGEIVQSGDRFDIFTRGFTFPSEREPAPHSPPLLTQYHCRRVHRANA